MTDRLTDDEIEAMRERCEGASEPHGGSFRTYGDLPDRIKNKDGEEIVACAESEWEFVRYAYRDLPRLLDEVEGQRAEIERQAAEIERLREAHRQILDEIAPGKDIDIEDVAEAYSISANALETDHD